jgi:hypothetical protein
VHAVAQTCVHSLVCLAIYAFIRLFIHSIQLVLASLNLTMEQFFTTLQRVEEAGLRAFPSEL